MAVMTYREAVRDALRIALQKDKNVFLLGEDIGIYGGANGVLEGLQAEFGSERIRETPISENAFVGAAVGAAMLGMRPVVEIMFADFLSVCFDPVANQAAKSHFISGGQVKVPMVIRCPICGETGVGAQHSQSPEALFCHMSGLKVVMPSCAKDAKGLLLASMEEEAPVLFFEPKGLYSLAEEVPEGLYTIPLGKAELKRTGEDVSLISYGRMLHRCVEAAEALEGRVSVEVVDLRSLSPLDMDTVLKSLAKTGRAVIVHEASRFGGFGAEIAAEIAESGIPLKSPLRRVCALDCPIPCSREMEALVYPTKERIEKAILDIV